MLIALTDRRLFGTYVLMDDPSNFKIYHVVHHISMCIV
jgi:hypothetical protein